MNGKTQSLNKQTQSLYKKRYLFVHEYVGEDFKLADSYLTKNPCSLIGYMRDTYSQHTIGTDQIRLPIIEAEKTVVPFDGHTYVILKTKIPSILVYEQIEARVVSGSY